MTALVVASIIRAHFGSGVRFIGSFGTAKATALVGVLLLARLLPPAAYGAIELALTVGLLVGVVGSLGVPLAVPQLYLSLARRHIEDLLAAQVLLVVCGSTLVGMVLWRLQASPPVALGVMLAGLFAAQSSLSAYCRVRRLRTLSGWVDNLCLIVVTVLALLLLAAGRIDARALAVSCGGILLVIAVAATDVMRRHRRPDFLPAYRDALARGGPMMANALVIFGITGSLRLILGYYLPLDDVAVYSLCSRLCLVLLVVHQLAATGLFAQIYTLPADRCDRWFALCLGGLLLIGAVLVAVSSTFMAGWRWGALDMASVRALFPIVCAQTVLWIVSAWLDMLLNREGLASRSAIMLGVLLAGFGVGVVTLDAVDALGLVTANLLFTAIMYAAVLGQIGLLARHGHRMPRLQKVVLFAPALALPTLL